MDGNFPQIRMNLKNMTLMKRKYIEKSEIESWAKEL